jgi:hypothetical protein
MKDKHYYSAVEVPGEEHIVPVFLVDEVSVRSNAIEIRNVDCAREAARCESEYNVWLGESMARIPVGESTAAHVQDPKLLKEPDTAYRAYFQFSGDVEFDLKLPWLAFLCVDIADCEANVADLRALIALMRSPGFVPPGPARVAPEIAGLWELYVPTPQGQFVRWTLEFGADGNYRFTDGSNGASHQGTYQSASGQWSLAGKWTSNLGLPPATAFEDGGTYRLLAADAMELKGRFGAAVWRKRGAPQ